MFIIFIEIKSDYTKFQICTIFALTLIFTQAFLKLPAYFFTVAQRIAQKSIRKRGCEKITVIDNKKDQTQLPDEQSLDQCSITPNLTPKQMPKGPRRQLTNRLRRERFFHRLYHQNFFQSSTTNCSTTSFEANSQADLDITDTSQRAITPTSTDIQLSLTPVSKLQCHEEAEEPSLFAQTLIFTATAFPIILMILAFVIILFITANTSQDGRNVWVRTTMISWMIDFLAVQFCKGLADYFLIKLVAPNNPKRGRLCCPDIILKHFVNSNVLQRMKEIDNIEILNNAAL